MPREAKPTVVFAVSGINVDVSEIKHCMTLCPPPPPVPPPLTLHSFLKLRDNVAIVFSISIAICRVVVFWLCQLNVQIREKVAVAR